MTEWLTLSLVSMTQREQRLQGERSWVLARPAHESRAGREPNPGAKPNPGTKHNIWRTRYPRSDLGNHLHLGFRDGGRGILRAQLSQGGQSSQQGATSWWIRKVSATILEVQSWLQNLATGQGGRVRGTILGKIMIDHGTQSRLWVPDTETDGKRKS